MVGTQAVEKGIELSKVSEVADSNCAPANLVLVGGADASAGRADLARARGIFAKPVEVAVDRKDQWAGLGNPQHFRCDFHTLLTDSLNLGL